MKKKPSLALKPTDPFHATHETMDWGSFQAKLDDLITHERRGDLWPHSATVDIETAVIFTANTAPGDLRKSPPYTKSLMYQAWPMFWYGLSATRDGTLEVFGESESVNGMIPLVALRQFVFWATEFPPIAIRIRPRQIDAISQIERNLDPFERFIYENSGTRKQIAELFRDYRTRLRIIDIANKLHIEPDAVRKSVLTIPVLGRDPKTKRFFRL